MFLTESEAERRLRDLHRERGRIDRAIADLTLFLEIGRQGEGSRANPDPVPAGTIRASDRGDWPRAGVSAVAPADEAGTDRIQARREGRLLMEAAGEILHEAGRPLHAAAILEGLAERGLSVPGADPVAALNTRLWKRSGPDGPFQRLGDAVYALAGRAADEDAGEDVDDA